MPAFCSICKPITRRDSYTRFPMIDKVPKEAGRVRYTTPCMDDFSTKITLPLLGILVLLGVLKVVIEIVIPDLVADWRNKRRFKLGEKWRSNRELIQWLREMKPYEFESYIAEMFKRLGYNAEAVGRSHDGGVDVIIEKDGVKGYVQCKKYITSTVAVGDVRDFYGALVDKLTNGKGYFITTNKFTLEATKFAEDKPIELIDEFALVKYVKMAYKDGVVETEVSAKVCPKCGNALVERKSKYGKFLGCSTYPKCDYTESVQGFSARPS